MGTKNPSLYTPAHENRSTILSSNPFERKTIGMMGSTARIARRPCKYLDRVTKI